MVLEALEGRAVGARSSVDCVSLYSVPLFTSSRLMRVVGRLAITLAFVIPREPTIAFGSAAPLSSSDLAPYTTASPPSFRFNANVLLSSASSPSGTQTRAYYDAVDASNNYLPLKFNSLKMTLTLSSTGQPIANATNLDITFPARQLTNFLVRPFSGLPRGQTDDERTL